MYSPGGGFAYGEFSAILIFIYLIPNITTTINIRKAIDSAISRGQYEDPVKKKTLSYLETKKNIRTES